MAESWAQAPGGETKGAEIFHWVDKVHVTCWLHHCPPGVAYSPRPISAPTPRGAILGIAPPGGETKGAEIFH